jgi:hypothetical protein
MDAEYKPIFESVVPFESVILNEVKDPGDAKISRFVSSFSASNRFPVTQEPGPFSGLRATWD